MARSCSECGSALGLDDAVCANCGAVTGDAPGPSSNRPPGDERRAATRPPSSAELIEGARREASAPSPTEPDSGRWLERESAPNGDGPIRGDAGDVGDPASEAPPPPPSLFVRPEPEPERWYEQMLAIGRGMMAEPRLLILDEPSLGLSPLLVEEMFTLIGAINREGLSVLLVEQNVFQALEIAHRGCVLENGTVMLHGEADALLENPDLKRSYLGL